MSTLPSPERSAEESSALTYPLQASPQPGEAIEAAPGVLWLRMPVPGSLDHINVWALEDGEGWTLADTGMQTPETTAGWQSAFAGPLAGRRATRVICTLMHPDHIA